MFADILVVVVMLIVGIVALVEFLAGCGETYTDAKGQRHEYGCLLITP